MNRITLAVCLIVAIVVIGITGTVIVINMLKNNDNPPIPAPPKPQPEYTVIRKIRAVAIGANRVDPSAYRGWEGKLPDCEYDAMRAADLWESYGIPTTTLLTENATRNKCYETLKKSISELTAGDLLIVWISGHGGQMPDYSGDESDQLDEYVCAYDGPVTDDTINKWLSEVPEGICILWICDTCHSGTMYKIDPPVFSKKAMSSFKGQLILISGSTEDSYSISTGRGGVLSNALQKVSPKNKSPKQWFEEAIKLIPKETQQPQYVEYGKITDEFRYGIIVE